MGIVFIILLAVLMPELPPGFGAWGFVAQAVFAMVGGRLWQDWSIRRRLKEARVILGR